MIDNNNPNAYVRSITKFNSKLYLGADQGLFISDNNGVTFTKQDFCSAGNSVTHLYNKDDQTLYISTMYCGLYTLSSNGTLTNYNSANNGLGSGYMANFPDWITGVLVDDNGVIYIITWGGGIAISDDNLQSFTNKSINGDRFFTAITIDSHNALIIGTSNHGIYVTLDQGDTFAQLTPTNNNLPVKLNSTTAANIYNIILDDSEEIFVFTGNGLAVPN
jgi:ligand-binding sensor domain-containing protein